MENLIIPQWEGSTEKKELEKDIKKLEEQEIKPKPKCEICNDKKYINITDTIKSPCRICNK